MLSVSERVDATDYSVISSEQPKRPGKCLPEKTQCRLAIPGRFGGRLPLVGNVEQRQVNLLLSTREQRIGNALATR